MSTGPFGSSIGSAHFQDHGVPVLRGSNLSEDVGIRLQDDDIVFLEPSKAEEFSRSTVEKGDLIFTCWGTVGQVGLIDAGSKYPKYVISNKQMKLTPDPKQADSLFLYYLFSNPATVDRIKGDAIGSSVPGFNLGQLKSMIFELPLLDEQIAIAEIIGSIDNKILLLQAQNNTLEKIASALFASAIKQDPNVDVQNSPISKYFNITIGRTPPRKETKWFSNQTGIKWASIRDMGNMQIYLVDSAERLTCDAIQNFNITVVPKDTVLLSFKLTVGRVAISLDEFATNEAIAHFLPRKGYEQLSPVFLYLFLKQYNFGELGSTSSIADAVNSASIRSIEFPLIGSEILEKLNESISPIFCKIKSNAIHMIDLKKIRNDLLPKLMSGEVRVAT